MTEFMEATTSLPQTLMGSVLWIVGMLLLGRTMKNTLINEGRWVPAAAAVMYGAAFAALTLGAFLLEWL